MKKFFAVVAMAVVAVIGANNVDAQVENKSGMEVPAKTVMPASGFETQKTPVLEAETVKDLNPMMFEYGYKTPATEETQELKSVVLNDNSAVASDYVPGKSMRRTGMIMTGAGFTVAAAFGIYAANIAHDNPQDAGKLVGDVFGLYIATGAAAIGAAAGIVGTVLWTKGQHRMNNFKAANTGLGLAYTF